MASGCLLSFELLINKQIEWLQHSNFKNTSIISFLNPKPIFFFSILSNGMFDVHQVCILSCSNLSFWCLAQGLISSIHVFPIIDNLLHHLTIQLELPHLLVTCLTHCVYTHLIDPLGIRLLRCSCGNEHIERHDTFHDVFASITKEDNFSCDSRTIACFFFSHSLNI